MSEFISEQTPAEYFRDLVVAAMERQHVHASGLTEYYLVDLLRRFMQPATQIPFCDDFDQPLALRLRRALEEGGLERNARLRNLGDFSLFTLGFFSDSLKRRSVDVDYYISMGEYAYGCLSRRDRDALASVYTELSRKFVPYMDVLADISEDARMTNDSGDLLRLYERYLRTGSARCGRRLVERGVVPNASVAKKFLQ